MSDRGNPLKERNGPLFLGMILGILFSLVVWLVVYMAMERF